MTDTILIVDDQRSMCDLLEADLRLRDMFRWQSRLQRQHGNSFSIMTLMSC